jgi:outer membrane lipoprotein LolB
VEILQGEEHSHWDITDPAMPALAAGWHLPVAALPYWLRGIPAPQIAVDELALESERLSLLRQAGWEISVQRYGRFGDLDLPVRLQIRHEERLVRLVIRRWHPETSR